MDTQEPPPSLLSLPNELLALIAEHLWCWQDAAALSHTCKRMRWLAEEVFRRWDLNWEEEKAWLCLTRPDEVRASEVRRIEVSCKEDWYDWLERVCETGSWDLMEWLDAQMPVMGEEDVDEVWENYAWWCATHEDGLRGLQWIVECFGESHADFCLSGLVAQRWACKVLPFLMDEVVVGVDMVDILPWILADVNHEATLAFLVDRGALIESREGLLACVACGDTDGVERALAAGIDVNSTVGGRRVLDAANDGEMVRLLVSRGADLEERDMNGHTPLLAAAAGGRVSAFLALQECGADMQTFDTMGYSALSFAAQCGDKEMLVKCLECGLDVHGGYYEPPIHRARDGETVRFLVAHGAVVEARGPWGNAPLHLAARDGRLSAMEALRACGADIEVRNRGSTALHQAASGGRPKAVAMLLKWGLQVDARTRRQETPLHCSLFLGQTTEARIECARLLLAHGADPEARVEDGQSFREMVRNAGGEWPEDLIVRVFGDA